jgi:enoyl-CoA hydratase
MSERIRIDEAGDGVAVLTLDRREALNAFDTAMGRRLLDLFGRTLRDRQDVRCVVVTGAGDRSFSVGGDLKERKSLTNDEWRDQHAMFREAFEALWRFPWPTIAAVNGYAMGGGCELALGCDFIYAAEKAVFALPEIRLGIMPGAGGTQLLPRAMSQRVARELIYTGRHFSAEEAWKWGMVNRVLPASELLPAAIETAKAIAANAPLSVQGAKRSIDHGLQTDIATAMALEVSIHQRLAVSLDRVEGIAAFNEKRAPQWRGH